MPVSGAKKASLRKSYGLADPAKLPKLPPPENSRVSLLRTSDRLSIIEEIDPAELEKQRKTKARKSLTESRKQVGRGSVFGNDLGIVPPQPTSSWLETFLHTEEAFVKSDLFEVGCGLVIIFSTVTMSLEVDQVDLPLFICFSENLVTAFFLIEWFMRVHVFKLEWFKSIEHLLDTFIVWIPGVLTVWFLQPMFTESSAEYVKTMRIIRMLRLLRLVAVFKKLPMMQDLWMLVRGLLKSGSTLVSALVLIVFTLYVFGIAAVDLIGYADYSDANEASRIAHARFQGLWLSMLTLTRFMHGDDAQNIMDELTDHQPFIWIFLWLFAACATFVLLNLVTAIICNEAFETSKADENDLAHQLKLQRELEMKEFKDMFEELDEDGSCCVSLDEFQAALQNPDIKNKLINMGLSQDMITLFNILDTDGEGELDLEEFMEGMQALSGVAAAKDMVLLTKGIERIEKSITKLAQGSLGNGVPTKEMLEKRMLEARVTVDKRLRKTENSLEDLSDYLTTLSDRVGAVPGVGERKDKKAVNKRKLVVKKREKEDPSSPGSTPSDTSALTTPVSTPDPGSAELRGSFFREYQS